MAACEVCGNDYYLSFEVVTAGEKHIFDCFESAIHKLAPVCSHCGCRIIGHGIESRQNYFCCASCARSEWISGTKDHIWKGEDESGLALDRGSLGVHFN